MILPVIFFRDEGWYPVELDSADIAKHVELNPGTIRIEDLKGNVLWSLPKEKLQ